MRALLLALSLLVAPGAQAKDLSHLVREGESFASLAKHFYGSESYADSLRLYNEIPILTAGTVLRVPFAEDYRVQAGDTWSGLASRHWGNGSLFISLSELAPNAPNRLRTGQIIRVPALIPYRMGKGETLASLSRLVYDRSGLASALARLNQIADPRAIRTGQILRIPILALAPETQAQPEPQPVASPPPVRSRYLEAIQLGADAHAAGNFEFALAHFEELRDDVMESGNSAERATLLQQLTVLYVAFERPSDACQSFRELQRLEPGQTWDAELTSPKIIRMTRGC
jgi:LysM repeat protein